MKAEKREGGMRGKREKSCPAAKMVMKGNRAVVEATTCDERFPKMRGSFPTDAIPNFKLFSIS
jgi:hypothetical protein